MPELKFDATRHISRVLNSLYMDGYDESGFLSQEADKLGMKHYLSGWKILRYFSVSELTKFFLRACLNSLCRRK